MKQGLSVLVHHRPDTLVRFTGLLYRRGYLLESLDLSQADQPGMSQITAVVEGADSENLLRHIRKLVEVVKAEPLSYGKAAY